MRHRLIRIAVAATLMLGATASSWLTPSVTRAQAAITDNRSRLADHRPRRGTAADPVDAPGRRRDTPGRRDRRPDHARCDL